MAKRNTFGVDETLESTFSWEMIRRCFVYIRREGRLFLRAFVLQALAMVAGLCGPLFSARVLDEAVPAGNIPMVLACCAIPNAPGTAPSCRPWPFPLLSISSAAA